MGEKLKVSHTYVKLLPTRVVMVVHLRGARIFERLKGRSIRLAAARVSCAHVRQLTDPVDLSSALLSLEVTVALLLLQSVSLSRIDELQRRL